MTLTQLLSLAIVTTAVTGCSRIAVTNDATELADASDSNGTDAARPLQCGDGILSPTEQCDDGNANNDDSCTSQCRFGVCGDGIKRKAVEACDDGNLVDNDGCTSECIVCSASDFVYGGHCYRFLPGPYTWNAGRTACSDLDGVLVSLEDDAEASEIAEQFAGQTYWLGLLNSDGMLSHPLRDRFESGQFGVRLFDAGEDLTTVGYAAAMKPNQLWATQPSGNQLAIVCEISNAWYFGRDRHGYRTLGTLNGARSWDAAKQECEGLGATLASFETAFELGTANPFHRVLRQFDRANIYWVGADSRATSPEFRWLTDTPVISTLWGPQQPNNPATEQCGGLTSHELHDAQCAIAGGAVCEAP